MSLPSSFAVVILSSGAGLFLMALAMWGSPILYNTEAFDRKMGREAAVRMCRPAVFAMGFVFCVFAAAMAFAVKR